MSTSLETASEFSELEARAALLDIARRRTSKIPADLLVDHLLRLYFGAGWTVLRAAMEALLRRLEFAKRDRLAVALRPAKGEPFGTWRLKRTRGGVREWTTVLDSLDPIRGSCDCPDYLRGSLGACKHLLVAIDDLARRPRAWKGALAASARLSASRLLTWDPLRPLEGPGDWLDRIELHPPRAGGKTRGVALERAMRHFRKDATGSWRLKTTHRDDPPRRLALVTTLHGLTRRSARGAAPDPAVVALLTREGLRLERVVGDGRDAKARTSRPRALRRKLYPYQVAGVKAFLASGRLLLADDMGLGKTAQAIACCHALFHAGRVRRGLLIVPASLKSQWQREWELFSDAPVAVVDGSPAEREAIYRQRSEGFLIANYEQLLRDAELIEGWSPQLICLDEAQRIKNWATRTAAHVKALQPAYRLVLTGTPLENKLGELASIMDWVDDHALEPKWRLGPWHLDEADGRTGTTGVRHLETLRERLAPTLLRRLRKDVLSDLPPRTDTLVPVPLTEIQAELHDDLKGPIARLVSMAQRRPLTQAEFLRLMSLLTTQRIISNGIAQLEFTELWPTLVGRRPQEASLRRLSSPKLIELRSLLRSLVVDQGRKVVVFSQWRRMLTLAHWAVHDILEDEGLSAAFFTGAENQRRRTRNIVEFHDDPSMRVLFTSDAGGVGLNLQRAANACINLELPWNPAVLEQRIGRIYRIGQRRPIDVFNLISEGSIEQRILALVSNKRELFNGVFDSTSDEVKFDQASSFFDSIRQIVEADASLPLRSSSGSDEDEGAGESNESEVDALLATADESEDSSVPGGGARPSDDLSRLLSQVVMSRSAEGGLRIEAPPEAATTLASLFDGLGRLMREAAEQPEHGPGGVPAVLGSSRQARRTGSSRSKALRGS